MNVFIQAVSFTLLADPLLLTLTDATRALRKNVAMAADPDTCVADQAAVGLYQLVVVEFVLGKLIEVFLALVMQVYSRYKGTHWKRPEFDLPVKMVNLLYFQGLAMACLPWAPLATLPFALMVLLSFHYDVWFLLRFQAKPKRPWMAQDAGAFFIKFYLATVLSIAFVSVYSFMQNANLPKNCDLFDRSVGLCAEGQEPIATATLPGTDAFPTHGYGCLRDSESDYYEVSKDAGSCGEGDRDYPGCYCNAACGPFVGHGNAYAPFLAEVDGVPGLRHVYSLLVDHVIVVWVIVALVYLGRMFAINALRVAHEQSNDRERQYLNANSALEQKLRKQQRQMQKLRAATGASGEV